MSKFSKLFLVASKAVFVLSVPVLLIGLASPIYAAEGDKGFSLQVTPSPLIATLKPGEKTTLEMRIHNTNIKSEDLKMGLRSFSVSEKSGEISLDKTEPNEVKDFVSFADPLFNVKAGEWFSQKITIDTPKDAGFSYSFAITIARQNAVIPTTGTAAIEGSVAVFALFGVDKPGATRKFEISQFSTSKKMYEYLPVNLTLKVKNSGNTLVQPKGTVYIQRHSNDAEPLSAFTLNEGGGYVLPSTVRSITESWNEGFPSYQPLANDPTKTHLVWDWSKLSHLRIGKYVAKVVAVYDDGSRDVPVIAEISFWVIPWKIIGGLLIFFLLVGVGLWSILKKTSNLVKKAKHNNTEVS